MISHATEDLLLLATCMLDLVETHLSSRWKGSWLSIVGLLGCTNATKHPLDFPWYLRSQGRNEFLSFRDCIHQGLHKQGRLSRGWELAMCLSVVLEGSCEKIFVCNCFMILAWYTLEDIWVFSYNLSLGKYLCCVWLIFLLISNCVFNSTKDL